MAGIDELYRWLIALSLQVRKPEHVAAQIEDVIKLYAGKLTAWPAPVVRAVLERWPSESDWWPTWHELQAVLPEPGAGVRRLAHGSSPTERFVERTQRLGVTGSRLRPIGVAGYGRLVTEHRRMSDGELLAEFDRLDGGRR